MLESLSVANFAIIDHIDLGFRPGMTVLTGETGAGKSLLIDAISLLLGDRAASEMVRTHADKATIIGVFGVDGDSLRNVLSANRIDAPDGRITIRREITVANKNTIRINETNVTLQQLKDIAKHLADVHSQFDTQRLVNPANYLELIDGFKRDVVTTYLSRYREALEIYRKKIAAYQGLKATQKELADKNDLYRFQLSELAAANLAAGEEESLKEQAAVLANFDKICDRLQTIRELLGGTILDPLYEVSEHFAKLGEISADFRVGAEKTKDFYYELDDLATEIKKKLASMNFDPDALNAVSERLNALEHLKKKYKMTISGLLDHLANLKKWIDQTENFDGYLQKAGQEVHEASQTCFAAAKDLSALRRQIADRIEIELKPIFRDLALPNALFSIVLGTKTPKDAFEAGIFAENGLDEAEFLITTNVGEPQKPLSKTASGGEMSRLMLGFKTIFIKSQNLSTIVFDEIDTGISGVVARQIARKIKEISATCQVISISHIPQVVALAATHLKVWKKEENQRTSADVKELTFEERVREIAEMIAGEKVTETSLQSARELLLGE